MSSRNIDAIGAMYTDDARVLAPNAEMTVGADSIRAEFGGMIDAGLSVKLTSIEALVSGNLGINVGRYVLSADGKEVDDANRWLAAWRGENSRHKLFQDHGAAHVHTFRSVDIPHLTGLVISVADMGALQEMLESGDGVAAAEADGVRRDTLRVLRQTD